MPPQTHHEGLIPNTLLWHVKTVVYFETSLPPSLLPPASGGDNSVTLLWFSFEFQFFLRRSVEQGIEEWKGGIHSLSLSFFLPSTCSYGEPLKFHYNDWGLLSTTEVESEILCFLTTIPFGQEVVV